MSPRRQHEDETAKVRNDAVRKLEQKEAEQDAAIDATGEPVRAVGRTIHEGRISGA